MRKSLIIAKITIQELIYERVFYILVFFLLMSLGLSFFLGQMTYAEQRKMTLDFMLAGVQLSMVLLSIFMGITLLKKELALGSAAMILSKPVSRAEFLLGKYLGQQVVQAGLIFFMISMMYFFLGQEGGGGRSILGIFQAGLMVFLEAMVLSAITYMVAVFASSITAAVVSLSFFLLGHMRETLIKTLGDTLDKNILWIFAKGIVPDLEIYNIKPLVSYGLMIGAQEVGWAALYALCCTVFFLTIGVISFSYRDILT